MIKDKEFLQKKSSKPLSNRMSRHDLIEVLESKLELDLSSNLPDPEDPFYKELKSRIANYLEELMLRGSEKIFQILYRVDVPEIDIKSAFELGPGRLAADKLATAIIERQLKKIETQKAYKKSSEY